METVFLLARTSMFNFSFLPKYAFYFWQGVKYTLLLSVVSVAIAVIPALLLALMRLSKNRIVRSLAGAYIAVFRSTPMLVQLYIVYYGLFGPSGITIPSFYLFGYLNIAQFFPGGVALALTSAA